MAACVTAHAVTVLLMRRSILTEKIARRGFHLAREYRVDPFTLMRVRDVMVTAVETVPDTMTLHQAAAFLTSPEATHPSFPVVNGDRKVLGIVDPPAVLAWRRAGKPRHATLGALLEGSKLAVAYPDEYVETPVDRMMQENVSHLPVVEQSDGSLAGYISWKDLMSARTRLKDEEDRRSVFYRMRRGQNESRVGGTVMQATRRRLRRAQASAATPEVKPESRAR
jgi:CBS domain-containing protein